MSDRKTRMLEDKYLRDSARALVDADIKHLKADLAHKGVGDRIMDRAKEGALDLYEEAIEVAEDNKGALAALLAAVAVWFARNPLLSLLGLEPDEADGEWDEEGAYSER
ncbi:hypothetical protein K3152_03350 [Qipengyuania sp. 1NDH17]|uniref:Uncharacterized protein n=1 Tax=Qipengyuania polymorpha TaxID=2867234 RepID=A0ABS7IVK5_9SPHN|nr:hypothetical protein [Qipengyuania polymorpha]MBX7457273.1 hypothetical protein [Qipengyuania polymorpha]